MPSNSCNEIGGGYTLSRGFPSADLKAILMLRGRLPSVGSITILHRLNKGGLQRLEVELEVLSRATSIGLRKRREDGS